MEPPVSVASVVDGFCEVWAPVQDPQSCRDLVAAIRINVNFRRFFGRLSKRRKVPVRVQWSREDDIKHDYYHAADLR